ncbi:MAG: N-acetylmuramoyl-L-alanine amidase [Oscillochloris sp.]|nr:N-acetylmuramoyl-L-alanine amidase [Oscillochloris sp.]
MSRSAWGSPDGQGSRVNPAHYPVTHMVIHHTADSNSLSGSQQSWADRVRAIWSFHTYTRGWGDIGYNYLIDPNGVIYEGRAGGDDAVAFHDTANYGSMGIVLIGTYSNVDPQAAALNSAVDLLTWKSAQKRIDPLGRAFYYGCSISKYCKPFTPGSIAETISGHRDATPGRTSCPGDRLHSRIPELRQRVANRLAGLPEAAAPDNGDLIIDDLEGRFTRNSANWYGACGYGGSSVYTYSTDNPAESSNNAVWTPNIPADGQYRVLVHIPEGCDQATPTSQARYRINSADGEREVLIDQNARRGWIELGSFRFTTGTNGSVQLSDLTGEPLSAGRVVYFDAVQFVKEDGARIELLAVQAEQTSVAAGELLKVTFTVRNSGNGPAETQDPQAGTNSDAQGSYDSANGYVYDEGECFLGAPEQDYPIYPKQGGSFRLTLGPINRGVACAGESGGYPWRWGLNGSLAPGETRDVIGYVRFREPGQVQLQAGVIREYVAYLAQNVVLPTITVTPERQSPAPAAFNENLQPLAHVYRLGQMPDNLLARTHNPLSIVKGELLGSFVWSGELREWGDGGPLPGVSDGFVIEQTRVFVAPLDGEYTFSVTSDDGAWLWVNGRPLVVNAGLHNAESATGTIYLPAGRHVLGFKYFERGGTAVAGYAVQHPGESSFRTPVDGLAGVGGGIDLRIGTGFRRLQGLTLAADDLGGSGAALLRASFDGISWYDLPGGMINMGELSAGEYHLRYRAVDAAGNESPITELHFRVDPALREEQIFLPLLAK